MKTFIKNFYKASVVFVGTFAFASLSFACSGGNQCPPSAPYISAGGNAGVWYGANGNAGNTAIGPVVSRFTLSESAGLGKSNINIGLNTCNTTDCTQNFAKVTGEASAAQRSASFISTSGPSAASSAKGDAAGSINANAWYKK